MGILTNNGGVRTMPRKSTGGHIITSIYLPLAVHDTLKETAWRRGASLSAHIREVLESTLGDTYKQVAPVKGSAPRVRGSVAKEMASSLDSWVGSRLCACAEEPEGGWMRAEDVLKLWLYPHWIEWERWVPRAFKSGVRPPYFFKFGDLSEEAYGCLYTSLASRGLRSFDDSRLGSYTLICGVCFADGKEPTDAELVWMRPGDAK